MHPVSSPPPAIVVIGGGPAGLMAAAQLTAAGYPVDLYDAMPSVGRKFLLAGIGGMNITHSEPFADFCSRYAERQPELEPLIARFDADAVRAWCAELGVETFIGTSGRIFPKELKAAPLLRTWLTQLKQQGLRIHPRQRWRGWDQAGQLLFAHSTQANQANQADPAPISVPYTAVVLAMGGASWKKLGSDGAWWPLLADKGIELAPLQPANCGFVRSAGWSQLLTDRFAGAPLKPVALSFTDLQGVHEYRLGEITLTMQGMEGSLIYAFSARLREMINAQQTATFTLDLCPHLDAPPLLAILHSKPSSKSLGTFLKSRLKLDGVKAALVFELCSKEQLQDMTQLAGALKALPVTVTGTTPLDEAISTAGGVRFEALDQHLMLKALPGVFCAGEMLDWEAPTGGYLLNACLATGQQAGQGVLRYLQTDNIRVQPT